MLNRFRSRRSSGNCCCYAMAYATDARHSATLVFRAGGTCWAWRFVHV